MPVTYGYYIYKNKFKEEEFPSLQYDGYLTAKAGDVSTIVKWTCGSSIDDVKRSLMFDVTCALKSCDPEIKEKFAQYAKTIYKIEEERGDTLLEFGKITFDPESKSCNMEATCTTK